MMVLETATGRNSRHGLHDSHAGEPDGERTAQHCAIDPRLVFLARAAARYELVRACAMDLDEAWSGLFDPPSDPWTQPLLPEHMLA
jgi:hypothetical protein